MAAVVIGCALAGERFVGPFAKYFAQVSDRRVDLGKRQCGEWSERETA